MSTTLSIHLALEGKVLKGTEIEIVEAVQSRFNSNLKRTGRVILNASVVGDSSSPSAFESRPSSYKIQVGCSAADLVVVESDRIARVSLKLCSVGTDIVVTLNLIELL